MSPQDSKKQEMLDRVAEGHGVAVVVLDDQSVEISASNNNSICRALYPSKKFGSRCAEYCGVAFRETSDGADFEYECHAGLKCKAGRIVEKGKPFVAIVGRTFTSAENYRKATDRATAGGRGRLPIVLIAGVPFYRTQDLDAFARGRTTKAATLQNAED